MRSSKSRSRSKSNRTNNRPSGGNVVNRVFDSSGPEGKVRGTPQQIIDKYNQLARDAQLSNDRVAAENFQQHAEHYLRMLSEAQREIDQRREEQERQNRERQADRDRDRDRQDRDQGGQDGGQNGGHSQGQRSGGDDAGGRGSMAVAGDGDETPDSNLVETPESGQQPANPAPAKPKRKPRPRKPKADGDAQPPRAGGDPAEAAE